MIKAWISLAFSLLSLVHFKNLEVVVQPDTGARIYRSLIILVLALWAPFLRGDEPSVGIRLAFEPATLDWNLGDVPIHVINNVAEGLYRVSGKGKIEPDQAEKLPQEKEEGRWTITLRKNLKWSDGAAVRAQDYIYSWNRLRDPATASTYAYLLSDVQEAVAASDTVIEVRAKRLDASVFTHWATFPVRQDLVEKAHGHWDKPEQMAFNGAYKISAYKPGISLELAPNSNHRRPGQLAKIEALIVQDDSTALNLYESGRLHFLADLGNLERKSLRARPEYHSMKSPVLVYIGVDTQHRLLSDPSVRGILSKSVKRDQLPKLLDSLDLPTTGITPSDELDSEPLVAKQQREALQVLGGKILAFGYFEKGANRTLAEYLQSQWKKSTALNVELKANEIKSYWSKLAEKPYPLFLNTYGPPVWDERFYFLLFTSKNPMNMGRWNHGEYDRAVEKENWKKAREILAKQAPIIPLYFRAYEYLLSPKLKGVVLNPMTSLYLSEARLKK